MKKLGLLVMPLMTVSFLVSCGPKVKTYHIKFTSNNEVVEEKNYKENEVIVAPNDPEPYEKDHKTYTFEAWFDGETQFETGLKATKNYNFNAKFDDGEETIYYVYFKESEDDDQPDVQRLTYGSPIRMPGDLSDYKGDDYYWYRFTGWYDGETKLEEDAKCQGNQTFIAKFEKSEDPVSYFATFHAKDGDKKVEFKVGSTMQDIPETGDTPATGYTQYWLIGDNKVLPGTKDYDFTAFLGREIEANYTSIANPHTITLKVSGQDDVVINSAFGEKILSEKVPQKRDYYDKIEGSDHYYHYFTGKWAKTQGGTEYYDRNDTVDDTDLNIYADFQKDEIDPIIYKIRFLASDEETVLETKEIYCPDTLSITAPKIGIPGFTLTWVSDSYTFDPDDTIEFGDNDNSKLPIDNYDFVLTSSYEEYDITYDLNGGALPSGETNPTTYNVDQTVTLVAPEQDGFTFSGWYLAPNESKPLGGNGWGKGEMTGDITLYADWHEAGKTLNDHTWQEINDMSNGTVSKYFNIGETKTVSLTDDMGTRNFPVTIIDFNRDILEDSNGTAGITFELMGVILTKAAWGDGDAESFSNGPLNRDLNGQGEARSYKAMNTIQDGSGKLMNFVKEVNKKVRQYWDYNWHDSTYSTQLFPLSYNEINGDEDTSYNYYKGADDAKRKKDSSYWLRSPTEEDTKHVMFCDSEGRIGVKEAGRTGDVAPAFCI